MNKITVFTDGGARGNPGPAAIGVVIKNETGQNLHTISRNIGDTTNNVAEYFAVIAALEWLSKNYQIRTNTTNNPIYNLKNDLIIKFYLDSNLVVNQLNGLFKVKDGNLRELLLKARIFESQIKSQISYTHIPREKNREADRLVNQALDSV